MSDVVQMMTLSSLPDDCKASAVCTVTWTWAETFLVGQIAETWPICLQVRHLNVGCLDFNDFDVDELLLDPFDLCEASSSTGVGNAIVGLVEEAFCAKMTALLGSGLVVCRAR